MERVPIAEINRRVGAKPNVSAAPGQATSGFGETRSSRPRPAAELRLGRLNPLRVATLQRSPRAAQGFTRLPPPGHDSAITSATDESVTREVRGVEVESQLRFVMAEPETQSEMAEPGTRQAPPVSAWDPERTAPVLRRVRRAESGLRFETGRTPGRASRRTSEMLDCYVRPGDCVLDAGFGTGPLHDRAAAARRPRDGARHLPREHGSSARACLTSRRSSATSPTSPASTTTPSTSRSLLRWAAQLRRRPTPARAITAARG